MISYKRLSKFMPRFFFLWALLLCTQMSWAQFLSAPAFPGAEGFGRYTTGGRGGQVIHVTNLNDSGEGSLRAAINTNGKRIIVFDVAGTIALESDLKITNDDCTILGQTAPGDGICLRNYTLHINANNVIIRYIRCRMGDEAQNENDAMSASHSTGGEKRNIIIDHCSISWCVDECGSFYGNEDFTLQWCILSESLRNSVHNKGNHGYGGIWGGSKAAFHHNLLAHHDSRNPRFDHGYVSELAGVVDYINNVVYNWGGNSTYGGENKVGLEPKKFNMINNYYKPGPYTTNAQSSKKNRLLNPTTSCSSCGNGTADNAVPGQFYINGNKVNGTEVSITTSSSQSSNISFDSNYDWSKFTTNCVVNSRQMVSDNDFSNYNTISLHSADNAFTKTVQYAGASLSRDAIDTRIATETTNGTYTFKGSNGSTYGLIDTQTDAGGWPTLSGTASTDTDQDGIPDAWETEHGLSNSVDNSATYTLDKYGFYTDLEVYANYLVQSITKAERADATATFSEYYPLDADAISPISSTKATAPYITANNTGKVTISSIESNAVIYYTTDGTTPTTSSHQYTSSFTVSSACTVKAIAVVSGKTNSDVTSFEVTHSGVANAYMVDPADPAANADISSVNGITMTYGACTDWTTDAANITVSGVTFPYYAAATGSSGTSALDLATNMPTNKSYWVFTPTEDGTLTLAVRSIATSANDSPKVPYIIEDGKSIDVTLVDVDGTTSTTLTSTTLTAGGTIQSTAKSWSGGIKFDVKAGSTYTYSLASSKGQLCGFIFNSTSNTTTSELFSLTMTATSNVSVTANSDADLSSYATITGGTALVHNGHATSNSNMIGSNGVRVGNSGGSYVKISLSNALQAGDVITTTGEDGGYIATSYTNKAADNISGNTFTVPSSMSGATTLYITRGASYPWIKSITITRESSGSGSGSGSTGTTVTGTETTPTQQTSNVDIVGYSYTIAGSLNGGQGNASQAFKLQTKSTSFTINVNDNYTITSMTMTGAANYANELVITGVYIDGSSTNLLSSNVTFSSDKSVNSFSLSGFSAESSILVTYNSTSLTQLNTTLTFGYSYEVQPIALTKTEVPTSRNGVIKMTFNNPLSTSITPTATLGSKTITGDVSDNTLTFVYQDLDYSSEYAFSLPANSVTDSYGQTYASEIDLTLDTDARQTATKKGFDAVVSSVSELSAAIAAANTANTSTSADRYRILVLPGTYALPASTTVTKTVTVTLADKTTTQDYTYNDIITYLSAHNVSIVGLDNSSTTITNTPPGTYEGQYGTTCIAEGIGNGDVLQLSGNNTYFQDIKIATAMGDGRGRDIAVQDKGNFTIFKNTYLYGYQDTYTNNKGNGRSYFEGGVIRGRTDYICGKADIWYEGVTFAQIYGGYCAVPSTPKEYGWVMNNCRIVAESSTAVSGTVDGNYTLGRPWGSDTPVALWINTTMEAKPSSEGWSEMSGGWPKRFAEYNSVDANGNTISLSGRKTTFNSSYTNDPTLTAAEATYYSRARVMGSTDGWDPTVYTEQCAAPVVTLSGAVLSWAADDYTSSWVVLKDGVYYANPTTNSITLTEEGTYTVRTANLMGGLGTASNNVSYTGTTEDPNAEKTWDFSEFTTTVTAAGDNYTTSYDGLTLVGNSSSTYTSDYYSASAGFHMNGTSSSTQRYISYTPSVNGVLTVYYRSNNATATDRITAIGTQVTTGTPLTVGTDGVLAFGYTNGGTQQSIQAELTAGTTYYAYFANGGQAIMKLVFTPGATIEEENNTLALTDGADYTLTEDATYEAVTFTKTFSSSLANKWTSLYVPFAINVSDYASDFDIAEIYNFCPYYDTNGDGEVTAADDDMLVVARVNSGTTMPNMPYLIRAKSAGTVTINAVDGKVYAATNGSVSCYTTKAEYNIIGLNSSITATPDNNYYYMSSGTISHRTTGSTTIKANRWYMTVNSNDSYAAAAGAKATIGIFVIDEDDEVTGVSTVTSAPGASNGKIYTIEGQEVKGSLRPGLYIRNNRKFIVE